MLAFTAGLTQRRGDAGEKRKNNRPHTETQSHREKNKKEVSVARTSLCALRVMLFSFVLSLRLCASA
jgi:hypothetical protein